MRKFARAMLVWGLPVFAMLGAMLALTARPSGLAWLVGAHEIQPGDLVLATKSPSPPLLVDVRSEEEYRSGHVVGALWAPLGQLGDFVAAHPVPVERTIVTICAHGWRSAMGATEIAARGHQRVSSLAGGTAGWRALGLPIETGLSSSAPNTTTVVDTTWLEQTATVISAFAVKPLYMLLALALGLWLWRRRDRDLALLGRGMLLFFAGETLCAVRGMGAEPADLFEIGHGLGMVAMGAWFSWGLLELLDRRVLGFSDPARACALSRFCQRCWKRDPVACGLHRIMRMLLPVLAILCLVPLSATLRPLLVVYPVFGTLVRDESTLVVEIAEMRVYPCFALWLFAMAFLDLRKGRPGVEPAKAPFFVGLGCLSYALLRFFLHHAFGQAVVWANAWEEVTELLTVLTLLWILWVFRTQLELARPPKADGRVATA
jgi:rhodanese-related sulfurtransferase